MNKRFWNSARYLSSRILTVCGVVASVYLLAFIQLPRTKVPGRTAIDFWHVTGQDETEPPAPKWFNESQDTIHVNPVGVPFLEIERKFLTSIVGNVSPDVFEYFGSAAQWACRGALMPLDEFIERDGFDRSQVFPRLWDEVTWEGQTYAIPVGVSCDAFFWNKEHFRQAGLDPERPPRTWSELEEYAEKLSLHHPDGSLQRAGYIPGYWGPLEQYLFIFWARQKGAQFVSPDGRRVLLTSPACVEALEWEGRIFNRLGREELIRLRSSFGYGAQHGFLSGRVSMCVNHSSLIPELSKFAPELDFGVSRFPLPEGGQPATTVGSVWIAIPAGAPHPREAWEYIRYYTQTRIQQPLAEYAIERNIQYFLPANVEVAHSPRQMETPYMPIFIDSMDYSYSSTVIPLAHAIFWREYLNAWDVVMRGMKPAPESLGYAEREIQNALDGQLAYNDFYREHLQEKD